MSKVKVEVTGAVVDGNPSGSIIEVDEKSADKLENIGYVRKVVEESKPKQKTTPRKSKSKSKEDSEDNK